MPKLLGLAALTVTQLLSIGLGESLISDDSVMIQGAVQRAKLEEDNAPAANKEEGEVATTTPEVAAVVEKFTESGVHDATSDNHLDFATQHRAKAEAFAAARARMMATIAQDAKISTITNINGVPVQDHGCTDSCMWEVEVNVCPMAANADTYTWDCFNACRARFNAHYWADRPVDELFHNNQHTLTFFTIQSTMADLRTNLEHADCSGHIALVEEVHKINIVPEMDSSRPINNYYNLDVSDQRDLVLDGYFIAPPAAGAGTYIYILDTGVDCTHDDFRRDGVRRCLARANIVDGIDNCDPTDVNCAMDRNGHGTHVAGVAASKSRGVSAFSVIKAIKALDDNGGGSMAEVVAAFGKMVDDCNEYDSPPCVGSVSLGGEGSSTALEAAVNSAVNLGVVVVAAAGNGNMDACRYTPAQAIGAVVVGSVDFVPGDSSSGQQPELKISSFSNYGNCVDIWAVGKDIMSTMPTGGTAEMSGTSMAAPLVAGITANIRAQHPTLNSDVIKNLLSCSGTKGLITNWGMKSGPNLFAHSGEVDLAILLPDGSCNESYIHQHGAMQHSGATTKAPRNRNRDRDERCFFGLCFAAGALCFPGDALVEVDGGAHVPISSLQVGDKVLSEEAAGRRQYEPVLGFLHTSRAESSKFLTVKHASGEFRASGNHIVFVAGSSDGVRMERAVATLTVGDKLLIGDGASSTVVAIREDIGNQGMFAPLTVSGKLIVDGVIASNYAKPAASIRLPHSSAQALFFPVRAYHQLGLGALLAPLSAHYHQKAGQDEIHPFIEAGLRYFGLANIHQMLAKSF